MKKLFTRLNRRRGFTLVECLIALTVFAALTLVVFAILTNARNASMDATESEENLTKLIDNVISDETFTKYNSLDKNANQVLTLNIEGSSSPFRVSYTEIDGYKNFVLCPVCDYFADNNEFMTCEVKDFGQVNYVCPKCSESFEQTLICEECDKTGAHTNTSSFTYMRSTGGYYCNDCGSTGVRGIDVDANVISNNDLNIKTLVPNAIIYGNVTRYDDPNNIFDTQDAGGGSAPDSDITMWLTYTPGPNTSIPGTYKLRIKSNSSESNFQIIVRLPSGYKIPYLYETLGSCKHEVDAITGEHYLKFSGCSSNSVSEVDFQLVNSKSGLSFEDDYSNPTDTSLDGLKGYWFHINTNSNTANATFVN